jgi:ribonuclease HI
MLYYAVSNGREKGIFNSWDLCSKSVIGYKNSKFKKFKNYNEAVEFININKTPYNIIENTLNTNVLTKRVIKCHKIDYNYCIHEYDENMKIIDYFVYTDGSCLNNGANNSKSGIGIFFGNDDIRNVSKKLLGKQTNNIAELIAIIDTYDIIKDDIDNNLNIMIVTDSKYSILCITSYGNRCELNNWDLQIPNKYLVKKVYDLYKNIPNVHFKHISAHTNNNDIHSIGNRNADILANNGCKI